MSNNPFAGWTMAQVEEHNRRVALGRMRGNPTSEMFEKAQRDKTNGIRISNFSDPLSFKTEAKVVTIPGEVVVSKNGRRRVTIGGKDCSFRSHWEVNFAYYLEFLKTRKDIVDWEYEPQAFYFDGIRRGTTNYTPDFKLTYPGGRHEWREVKGWMSPKDKTKLKRMKKFFPEETIKIIDGDWFKLNGPRLAVIVPGWSKKKR